MKLIIGLGNPGKEYEKTRHNAGFLAIDALCTTHNLPLPGTFDKKSNAELITWSEDGTKILLVKPQTFMNESGQSVRALLDFYKLSPDDIIVLHDDKDIPLGEFRVHKNRGAAGHNGVLSIIKHLGTKDFIRIRIGVGPKDTGIEKIIDYVLQKFSAEETAELKHVIAGIVKTIFPSLL